MIATATLYADLDQLLAWFAAAPEGGAAARWAVGAEIDPGHAAARQVEEWRAAGAASTSSQSTTAGRVWLVRKVGGSASPSAQPQARDDQGAALLSILNRAAARGEAMPSYATLGEAMGLRDRMAARAVLMRLQRRRQVTIERRGGLRRVTIVSTGAVLQDRADSS